jgi:hypothetical protein
VKNRTPIKEHGTNKYRSRTVYVCKGLALRIIFFLFLMIIHHGNLRSTIEPPLLEKKTGFMSPPSHFPLGRRQLMEDGVVIQNKERTYSRTICEVGTGHANWERTSDCKYWIRTHLF